MRRAFSRRVFWPGPCRTAGLHASTRAPWNGPGRRQRRSQRKRGSRWLRPVICGRRISGSGRAWPGRRSPAISRRPPPSGRKLPPLWPRTEARARRNADAAAGGLWSGSRRKRAGAVRTAAAAAEARAAGTAEAAAEAEAGKAWLSWPTAGFWSLSWDIFCAGRRTSRSLSQKTRAFPWLTMTPGQAWASF